MFIGHLKKAFYNRLHYIMDDTTLLSRDSLHVIYHPVRNQPNWVQWNGMRILFVALLKIQNHELIGLKGQSRRRGHKAKFD